MRLQQSIVTNQSMCHMATVLDKSDVRFAEAPHIQKWLSDQQNLRRVIEDPSFELTDFSVVWVANKRLYTGLHYDDSYNTLTLFRGIKHVVLYPPEDARYLYTVNDDFTPP